MVVRGLNVELTSVYWVPCSSACRRPVLLRPLTNVDRSFVASSMPFDGTGRHVIRHVLVVAARNRTSVRLELPQSAVHFETGGRIPVPQFVGWRKNTFLVGVELPQSADNFEAGGRIHQYIWGGEIPRCFWDCRSRLATMTLVERNTSVCLELS